MKIIGWVTIAVAIVTIGGWAVYENQKKTSFLLTSNLNLVVNQQKTQDNLANCQKELGQRNSEFLGCTEELTELKNEDQKIINEELKKEIGLIEGTFPRAGKIYEEINDLKGGNKSWTEIDGKFAQSLRLLGEGKYEAAGATMSAIEKKLTEIRIQAAAKSAPATTINSNNPPEGGFQRQTVKTSSGDFVVAILTVDLGTNKIVVDTVSERDCRDNCPVLPLAQMAQRSGAWAAINGPYFCPATYPSCADKKNSFDTLMMNKNKVYFNSENNVYSSVPAAIFSTSSRFVTKSLEWGRDTGVDSVIAGQPLLVYNGQNQFLGDGDPKKSGKGMRVFMGGSGSKAYLGLAHNVTVAEMALVISTMQIPNAINLDSGGSSAMWLNGKYVAGPGRDLPFGIMVVRR